MQGNSDSGETAARRHVLAVFIGRFQPFHRGHVSVMEHAAGFADSAVILVGSAFRASTPKNPLSFSERAEMIAQILRDLPVPVTVLPLVDTLYDDAAWGANVRAAIDWHIQSSGLAGADVHVVLTGYEKDKSSAYVRWFPDWGWNGAPPLLQDGATVNATQLRAALYAGAPLETAALSDVYGSEPVRLLAAWAARTPDRLAYLRAEAAVQADFRARQSAMEAQWGYPVPLNTVDAVVVCAGHVCLIRRAHAPGKGMLALPGGYFAAGETGLEAALRELREETGLDLSRHTPTARRMFDHPDRSERGWIRGEAFLFRLDGPRPVLRAGDDAAGASWVPLAAIRSDMLFEDHFDILETLVPEVPAPYTAMLSARRG